MAELFKSQEQKYQVNVLNLFDMAIEISEPSGQYDNSMSDGE